MSKFKCKKCGVAPMRKKSRFCSDTCQFGKEWVDRKYKKELMEELLEIQDDIHHRKLDKSCQFVNI